MSTRTAHMEEQQRKAKRGVHEDHSVLLGSGGSNNKQKKQQRQRQRKKKHSVLAAFSSYAWGVGGGLCTQGEFCCDGCC